MPGLVAVIGEDGAEPVRDDEIRALADVYGELRGPGRVTFEAAGTWATAAAIEDGLPVTADREGDSWCLSVGSMYAPGSRCAAPVEALDGQFAAIRFAADRGDLEVITDPFGMQDLYVASRGGRLYVSTSALVLARHLSAEPDPLGMNLFLRAGVQFGPVTHWLGVQRVEPATALCVRPGAPSRRRRYWTPEVDETVRAMNLRNTVDRCLDAGVELVGRRLREKKLISADITGGFDSRMVTALLDRARVPFETLTVAEQPTDERFARAVAETAGWPFRAQRLPGDWSFDDGRLSQALAWADGRLDVLTLAEVLWRQEDRSARTRHVLTGGGGENFGPSPWMQELWRAGRSRSVNYDNLMNMRVFLPLDVSVFASDPRAVAEPYVREVLGRRGEAYRGDLNTTQLDVIHAYREVGHFGAYRSAGEAHVRAELPCYFRDFWTVAFSSNHRWRNGHRLHRGIIERLHPAVASVGTERGGPAELVSPRNAARFVPYYLRLGRTAVRKVRGRSTHGQRPPARAQNAYATVVGELYERGVLRHSEMLSGALYERTALDALVSSAGAGGQEGRTLLGRIATVELALREAGRA